MAGSTRLANATTDPHLHRLLAGRTRAAGEGRGCGHSVRDDFPASTLQQVTLLE
jgi:hypothetical protein